MNLLVFFSDLTSLPSIITYIFQDRNMVLPSKKEKEKKRKESYLSTFIFANIISNQITNALSCNYLEIPCPLSSSLLLSYKPKAKKHRCLFIYVNNISLYVLVAIKQPTPTNHHKSPSLLTKIHIQFFFLLIIHVFCTYHEKHLSLQDLPADKKTL